MSGELVGINSAGIPDAQNIGFAISVGTISRILDDLKAGRTPKAAAVAYIGVNLADTYNRKGEHHGVDLPTDMAE